MIELERTYLAKKLPNLIACKKTVIFDIYLPKNFDKPKIRLRRNGEKYEFTKKYLAGESDYTKFVEETIALTQGEFETLAHEVEGKRIHKIRYYFDWNGRTAEFDVFHSDLKGLVLVDFKFSREEEIYSFSMPSFCLADVTEDELFSGGYLCGKSYKDIAKHLSKYNYKPLYLKN